MTVTFIGALATAEEACVSIFGENADAGPVRRAPPQLLEVLAKWPGRVDEVVRVSLNLPVDFDISRAMAKNHVKAAVLDVCRVTVLHQGKVVGHAIRTNDLGLNAIEFWEQQWAKHHRLIRRAH